MIRCRAAVPEDAALIGPRLRPADAQEAYRLGMSPIAAIGGSIERSECAGVFETDGEPLCVFGLERPVLLDPTIGCPWMVGTPLLDRHRKAMLRETRRWVQEWQQSCRVLYAWADADYDGAIRWLHWLGFETQAREVGPGGAPFWRMVRWAM